MIFKDYISSQRNERDNITQQMYDLFSARTMKHISFVRNRLDEIIKLHDDRIITEVLVQEKSGHDLSKYTEPEYIPYVHITYKYYLESKGMQYIVSDKLKERMHLATFHHITTNSHHAEYWDSNITIKNLNRENRDKPPEKKVDATRMPLSYVATMVADWMAMSDELGGNPTDWANKNIGIRWDFDDKQVKLIYDLLKIYK